MSYTKDFEKKKKDGMTKDAAIPILRFKEPGDSVIGKIVKIQDFTRSKFDGKCNQYVIDTDNGMRTIVLGAYTDSQIAGTEILNHVVSITFEGKEETPGGTFANHFTIEVV